jgi:hypothetical protein
MTPSIMNSSQLSEENSENELFKVFDKLNSKISHKELKKVKQENEYLPFVLLRQKGRVFFILDWECIFKPVK